MRSGSIAIAAMLLCSLSGVAGAATLRFATELKGSDEVPANMTPGKGKVTAMFDTDSKTFSYKVTYSGLTGPATMAHFHGPAAPGANAPPVIAMTTLPSPIKGVATLTDAQAADLKAGMWYFNVHTAANPGGEIRGQLQAAP